jgi:YidC/Oxa1 family membrane protein insertase
MRINKPFAIMLIALITFGYVLSIAPVFASDYSVSVSAENTAYQGSRGSAFGVKVKNTGNDAIESADVYIAYIDGKPVTSNSVYQVDENPQVIKFLGVGDERRVSFPISVDRSIEPGMKDVEIIISIDDENIEKEGLLEVIEMTEPISSDSDINTSITIKMVPEQSMRWDVKVINPEQNSSDIDDIKIELIGVATNPEYTEIIEVPNLTTEEYKNSDFFTYTLGSSSTVEINNKPIEPGRSASATFIIATGPDIIKRKYYPVFNVTYETAENDDVTVEIRDPDNNVVEVVPTRFFKEWPRWFLDMLKNTVGFGSYGIAIVILGILLKIILIPLTNIQFKSMKQNAEIQPLIKKINENFPGKENAQKRQEETMKIYKENNINMFAGCLPMLVQLPIIIALYTAISNYAPLNYQGFLWMPSLGIPDPIYIMVILMAGFTWVQQRASQMPGQEQNMAMQIIFPLFLGWIALSFPTGLTVYWVTFTIASVAHQLYFNYKSFGSYFLTVKKSPPNTVDASKGK